MNTGAKLLLSTLAVVSGVAGAGSMRDQAAVAVLEQHTMLYYEDLSAARGFYGRVLGLESTFENEWVTLYRATGESYIGVVGANETAFHEPKADNAVMVSLVVEDVDSAYTSVSSAPGIEVVKSVHNHPKVPIRAFLVRDPGGYTIEFFQWLQE